MEKIILKTVGLDCANCALKLQEELEKLSGIYKANVVFVTGNIELIYDNEQSLKHAKNFINNFEDVEIIEKKEKRKNKSPLMLIIIASIFFLITLILSFVLKDLALEITLYVGYGLTYIIVGYPVLIKTYKSILKGHIFDENFLMTLASIGAILVSVFSEENEMLEAAVVMLLYQIGEYLQAKAVGSSRDTICKLVALKSKTANLFTDGIIKVVDPSVLKVNDKIVIKAGEAVPTDVIITSGSTSIDVKSLTGETNLVDVKVGDTILSGSINVSGRIYAKVIKEYKDSTVAKILDLVENSAANKAKPERFITKFAKYYTPIVCLFSLLVMLIGPFINYYLYNTYSFSDWVIKALSILVVSCPCALIISVPLTYFSGIGICAKKGILVKGATALDELNQVKIALFDKTGTLTKGEFQVTQVQSEEKDLMLKLASAIEANSNHPISKAISTYKTDITITESKEIPGMGMYGVYNDKILLVGNASLLKHYQINFTEKKSISTTTYVAYDNKYLGSIEVDDEAKPELKLFMDQLNRLGIKKHILLTGDKKERTQAFSEKYGITNYHAELLPAEKLTLAKNYQKEGKIMFVGDGINDSPVMVLADTSFSMGQLGSDAAVEASDFILINDNLNGIIDTIKISKKTARLVYENIIGSIAIKGLVMLLSLFSILPLWAAVLADVGVMLIAVLNALRVRL